MKRFSCIVLCLCCAASAYGQLETRTVLPARPAAHEAEQTLYDSLTNIRITDDPTLYERLIGQRILFYPRDIHADLKPVAYCNFLAEAPTVVRIDTVWLRKPRKKIRTTDFRLDTVYADAYRPRFFRDEQVAALGCSAFDERELGGMNYLNWPQTGWFTPAEAIEGRSFEIRSVRKSRVGSAALFLFCLRDSSGTTFGWFAHAAEGPDNPRSEHFPGVVQAMVEKYRSEYLGKSFFLKERKADAPGYVSPYFGLLVTTMQGEESRLKFGSELRCTELGMIGDGSGYAVPSFVFERLEDSVRIYIPLTRYPHPFGVDTYMQARDRAFMDELVFTPAAEVYARRTEEQRQQEEERLREEQEHRERKAMLYRKYGRSTAELILNGQVQIGMTREMCRQAWGSPEQINRMSGNWGEHEQWVYGSGCYLYFEEGILSTIQN